MKKVIFKHLRRWHRRLGISAAIFILFLSVSGIILNHSDDLSLPQSHVSSTFIWNLYGIKGPGTILAFQVQNKLLIAADEQIWLDDKLLLSDAGYLKSAVYFNGIIVAILNQELLLLSMEGEIIERMGVAAGIPKNINGLVVNGDKIWLQTDNGFYISDTQLLQWELVKTNKTIKNTAPIELSVLDEQKITTNFRSKLISWERVLLDIHSGRILGRLGPLFSDLVALLLILLSLSGIYMWIRSTRIR